jgi:hypothetical protein
MRRPRISIRWPGWVYGSNLWSSALAIAGCASAMSPMENSKAATKATRKV